MSYEAELADTGAGRDIQTLVSGTNPILTGVSIAAAGSVR